MEIKKGAYGYLIFTAIAGPMMPVMLAIGGQTLNIYEFLFLAYLLAVPSSLALVFATKKQHRLLGYLKNKRDLALICLIGLLNYSFLEFGTTYAERFISVALATVVYRSWPLIMLVFLPFILRERISKYQILALLLGFASIYFAFAGGGLNIFTGSNTLIILFMIGVAVTSALAAVLAKKYSFDTESSIFLFSVANMAFFGILFLVNGAPVTRIPTSGIMAILYTGIVYNVLVAFTYYAALRRLRTTYVTNTIFLGPFVTFIYAALVIGQPLSIYYIVIALMVSSGILVQRLDTVGGSYKAKTAATAQHIALFDVTSAFIDTNVDSIHEVIKNGGKVLAIKVHSSKTEVLSKMLESGVIKEADEIVYYLDTDLGMVRESESKFIAEIMGKGDGERILMGAGNPDSSEQFLNRVNAWLQDH